MHAFYAVHPQKRVKYPKKEKRKNKELHYRCKAKEDKEDGRIQNKYSRVKDKGN